MRQSEGSLRRAARWLGWFGAVALGWSGVAWAEEPALVAQPQGELLLRGRRFERQDFTADTNEHTLRQRLRLGMRLEKGPWSGLFQVQDVRLWGESQDTLGDFSAEGLDLHQGFVQWQPREGLRLRLGRQEVNIEDQRLIGAVAWLEQARSLDAVTARYEAGALRADLLYTKLAEDSAQGGALHAFDRDLFLLGGGYQVGEGLDLYLQVIVDMVDLGDQLQRVTVGGHAKGSPLAGIKYHIEGYGQWGEQGKEGPAEARRDIQAYLVTASAQGELDVPTKPSLALFGDLLSGDEDLSDDRVEVFDTLLATNHKFYGEMDFFLNIPAHTGGRGLVDVGARLSDEPAQGLRVNLTFHDLRAAAEQEDGLTRFGQELDLQLVWKAAPGLTLDGVVAVFWPGELFEARGEEAERFVYMTIHKVF
jgi:hypothetical protein